MKQIDDFLNNITMYRLALYILIFLVFLAGVFSFFKALPFSLAELLFSVALLIILCWLTNTVIAKVFNIPVNIESVYITALILALIITPAKTLPDLFFILGISIVSQASKYILAIGRKHIFNPAAFGVAFMAIVFSRGVSPGLIGASWWVGNIWMAPFVLIAGILILRKIKKFNLVAFFLVTALAIILGMSVLKGNNPAVIFQQVITDTPVLFFALVMLTEPQTIPPGKSMQIIYGSLVGLLFALPIHLNSFYLTPEITLLLGNIFSYIVSPKAKLLLRLKEKMQTAPDIYDFVFGLDKKLNFLPGQYMEWTLPHRNPDNRGVRRFFTIAASPAEGNLRIGVRLNDPSSSYKKQLLNLPLGGEVVASSLSGEFTLPKNQTGKFVFIAGGIGITPFRSIVKNMLDNNQQMDIFLFYSVRNLADAVYMDIFNQARKLGLKTIITISDVQSVPPNWQGGTGTLTKEMIKSKVSDYKDRTFYISGSHAMVASFEKTLSGAGLKKSQIKTDYFPGY